MMNKKGATLWGIFFTIILTMALFYGSYNYITSNYTSANITDNSVYAQSLADLQTSQISLEHNVDNITNAVKAISEADGGVVTVAWNGLTGLAYTLRLFVNVVAIGVNVWHAIVPGLSFLPAWAIILAEMLIIISIVLIIIGAFKGEAKT